MAEEWYKSFLNSKKWKECRGSYIGKRRMIDGGMCEECHKDTGYIVHHTVLITKSNVNNPEITLNHDLLKYVCKNCHDEYENHGVGHKKVKPLCLFDKDGQPVSLREIDRLPPE